MKENETDNIKYDLPRTGAVGVLLDIYEQSITELQDVIGAFPDSFLPVITDLNTTDESCKTPAAILSHVIHSGYGDAVYIQNRGEAKIIRPGKKFYSTVKEYSEELMNMFRYTEKVFSELTDSDLEEQDPSRKMKTNWGQLYDIEQLTEHAIVHVQRHTRQLKKAIRFKQRNSANEGTGI